MHINSLRFFDLAGFERSAHMLANEVGIEKMQYWEGVATNWSLYELTRSIYSVIDLKKPLTGGEEIPKEALWKRFPISRLLKASYNGSAFTSSIFCISQHPKNGGETFHSVQMGEHFSKLKSNVTRGKDKSIKGLIKNH